MNNLRGANPPNKNLLKIRGLTGVQPPHPKFRGGLRPPCLAPLIMRVSCSHKPLQHFYSLGSEILREVSDAKYLGIQIDNKLDWNKHISTVTGTKIIMFGHFLYVKVNAPLFLRK